MMFKKKNQQKKENSHSEKGEQRNFPENMPAEEWHQIAMEMSWGNGMLLPGGIPDGIWHFY